jgi:hypothetical protein
MIFSVVCSRAGFSRRPTALFAQRGRPNLEQRMWLCPRLPINRARRAKLQQPQKEKIVNEGVYADAYDVIVPDRTMEPRFNEGYILNVSPSTIPRKGDDVFIELAPKSGSVPKIYVKALVALDKNTVRLLQLNPKKTLTVQRKDVLALHKVVGAWAISPERMREAGHL